LQNCYWSETAHTQADLLVMLLKMLY